MLPFHPLVVHFPIALLTLYALLEFPRFRALLERPYWFYVKAVLVITGTLGAVVARQSGESIEDKFANVPRLNAVVEAHALTANVTLGIFAVLAVAYALRFATDHPRIQAWTSATRAGRGLAALSAGIRHGAVAVPLALSGLIALTITGALGGGLVHGPDADPVVALAYRLFGL